MKRKGKNILFLSSAIFILTVICLNLISGPLVFSQHRGNNGDSILNVKSSGFWKFTDRNIHIDGNWSLVNDTYDWISGAGTWLDPYLIENVDINGTAVNSTIIIENADAYFKIKNCTLYNSSTSAIHGGIILNNVSNGVIIDCEIYLGGYGVYFNSSHNITLTDCVIRNNDNYGVYLDYESQNNTIYENYVGYNKALKRLEKINNQDVNVCYYIIDDYFLANGESRNNITRNDELGSCEPSPIYGTLRDPDPSYDIILYVAAVVLLIVGMALINKRYKRRTLELTARTEKDVAEHTL